MKSKFFFGAFAVFVLVCLFFFLFFSGIVRACERQQAAPQPNTVGARVASEYADDYTYGGYGVTYEAADYVNYYTDNAAAGYQSGVVQNDYSQIDYSAPVVASLYGEAAGLYDEITTYRTYEVGGVGGHYQVPAVYNRATYPAVEWAGAAQWV